MNLIKWQEQSGTVGICYIAMSFLTTLTITGFNVLTSHHKIQPHNYHLALLILIQHIFTLKTQNIIIVAASCRKTCFVFPFDLIFLISLYSE